MNNILTLGDFLQQTGADAYFFDLSRRVEEIPPATLAAFEQTEIPYTHPFLRSAWLGILFRHPGEETLNIWFLRFPLDEQGKLIQAARDGFLNHLLESAGTTQSALDDNPLGFTPRPERMAVFHAKAAKRLGLPPSQFYAHAVDYFRGNPGFEQWNFVGVQGIADVAARLDEDGNAASLAHAIPHLPATPFAALCNGLENEAIDAALGQALAARIDADLANHDAAAVASALRGLSHCTDNSVVTDAVRKVLNSPLGNHVEILAAIAGRAWETLGNAELRQGFLEKLAACEAGQRAFDNLLADLLFIPGLGESLRQSPHEQHSPRLAGAIADFLRSSGK